MLSEAIAGLGIAIVFQFQRKTTGVPSFLSSRINSCRYANDNPPSGNEQGQAIRLLKEGVSSLAISPRYSSAAEIITNTVAIGTKQGRVIVAQFTNDDTPYFQQSADSWTISKYPVYSLECCCLPVAGRSIQVYAGCGDRYVHAWTLDNSESHVLGPHTGWVKAVAERASCSASQHRRLYSVGCNRIEGWEQKSSQWNKVGTISIKSSGKGTCTLSSDLLCLVTTVSGVLVAGGVDGRLHLFREDDDLRSNMPQQFATLSAHDGRINSLCFEPTTGLLFSASHDETFACWHLDDDGTVAKAATVQILKGRALCCTCWFQDSKVFVATGSNDGFVAIHRASVPNGENRVSLEFEFQCQLNIPGPLVTVNSIRCLHREDSTVFLLVGHSKGLHAFPLALESRPTGDQLH